MDRQTHEQTDGRQTVKLCFPLDAAGVSNAWLQRLYASGYPSDGLRNILYKTVATAYLSFTFRRQRRPSMDVAMDSDAVLMSSSTRTSSATAEGPRDALC